MRLAENFSNGEKLKRKEIWVAHEHNYNPLYSNRERKVILTKLNSPSNPTSDIPRHLSSDQHQTPFIHS